MADYLHELLGRLADAHGRSRIRDYRIPALWHAWEYDGSLRRDGRELLIDPHDYLARCIETAIIPSRPGRRLGGKSLSRIEGVKLSSDRNVRDQRGVRRAGDWIRSSTIYGMLVRTTTAWDHDGNGKLTSRRFTESGTFLKTIMLLPLLRRMGVNTIYMLPVAQHSDLYRKGDLGCPYAAKDFTSIEPRLADRLLGGDPENVELEFGAFVEAAHRMSMRVMVDFAPRSAARDHNWIIEHPEWFYWIDRRVVNDYAAPRIPGVTYINPIAARLHEVYGPQVVRDHLARFRHAPSVTAPERWARFADRARHQPPRDLVAAIGREFGVITPPGFSDCINDSQPPWSDVTFLRMYLDHPIAATKHLEDAAGQPPYVLFDVIKSSMYPGGKPNTGLWKALAGVLPYYQRFGIDGARIDMAHALPKPVERMILERPRKIDPDFCFMAEELGTQNHAKVHRAGYNVLIGPTWYMESRPAEGLLHEFAYECLRGIKVPALATPETPDTPRAITRPGGRMLVRMTSVLNSFLPRAVPFINSGSECLERQPMNLGLDSTPRNRFALRRDDPFFGKLAFFDPFVMHWTNPGGSAMVELLAEIAELRRRFVNDLSDPRNHFQPKVTTNAKRIVASGFLVNGKKNALVVLANADLKMARRATVTGLPQCVRSRREVDTLLHLGRQSAMPILRRGHLTVKLPLGGAIVLLA